MTAIPGLKSLTEAIKLAEGSVPRSIAISAKLAAMYGDLALARKLIESGASLDTHDREGWRPLHFAANNGHVELAELLLAHGAAREPKQRQGRTALELARLEGSHEVAALLAR